MADPILQRLHASLTGDGGRTCSDVPEEACDEQPSNFFKHVGSLAATKTGDGIADPKLTLGWLLSALGAPELVGLLVPVREAGSLLPQLVISGAIRAMPQRKWAWALGSLVQGAAVAGMAAVAVTLDGMTAGWAIVGLLAVFALARSVCSVSYKDVLGKTVSRSTRGTATGVAATVAAVGVLAFGVLLSLRVVPLDVTSIAIALLVAGSLWWIAAILFSTLLERPGATEGGGNSLRVARENLVTLGRDPALGRFIAVRGLLTATALAPPYLLATSADASRASFGELGPFVVASAIAGMSSTYVWGRLADRSSRRVLIASGVLGGAVLALAALVGSIGLDPTLARWTLPVLLFLLMISYQGVRLGRSTHLVDMATPEKRLAFTAISNTAIGGVLVFGGLFAALGALAGPAAVLAAFAVMTFAAAIVGLGLDEVQQGAASDDDSDSDDSGG